MANRYWISDVAANWNDTANWSTSSGGSGGASVPGSGDVAIFDAQGTGDCRLASAIDVAGISFAGYTATLDGASDNLNHTVGTTGVVYSSGTPTFSLGDGTWTCSGNWDVRSTTVSYNSGTLVLSGTTKNAYFNKDGTGAPACNNVTISGTITIPNVAYAVPTINGVLNITGTLTMSALSARILDLGDGATATVQSGGVLTGAGTIRWLAFDSNSSGISTMDGTWSIARTEFWPRLGVPTITPASYGGLFLFDTANSGTAVSWVPSAGSYTFDDFTVDTASVTITINCSTNNPNITFTGDVSLSSNAAWTKGTGTITFSGSADQTVDLDDLTVEDVVVNKSAGTVTFNDGFTTDSMTVTSGRIAFGATGDTIISSGNWTIGTSGQVDPTELDGWTWAVGGNLSLSGELGDLLNLAATAAWYLQVTGTATASYVNAAYSDASGYTEIDADDGTNTDGGNNINWDFTAAAAATPDAVSATWSVVAPSTSKSITPDAVSATFTAVTPVAAKSVAPAAVSATWTPITPATSKTLAVSPVSASWSVPTPTAGSSFIAVDVSPVAATWSPVAPSTAKTTTPDPVSATWTPAAPTTAKTLSVDPVALTWSIVAAELLKTTTPDQVAATWLLPDITTAGGAGSVAFVDFVLATWTVAVARGGTKPVLDSANVLLVQSESRILRVQSESRILQVQ